MLDRKSGFTLIEVVIVAIIVGILAAIAIPRYINLRSKAEEAAEKAVIANVKEAITLARGSFELGTNATEYSGVSFNAVSGYPMALDGASSGSASPANPFFNYVLAHNGVTTGNWTRDTGGSYTGPSGGIYTYNDADGSLQ